LFTTKGAESADAEERQTPRMAARTRKRESMVDVFSVRKIELS
jgi:hypothetical protein